LSPNDQPYDFAAPAGDDKVKGSGFDLNLKRVLSRVLKYWYVIILSVAVSLVVAFFINRYSDRIYTVRASIIILQSEENAGSKFLYNNELLNPFRNFYNEIYIMRSYPLLAHVVEDLNFDVSYFIEGNIKTTEYYDPDFPIEFNMIGSHKPYGRSVNLKINNDLTFSIELLFDQEKAVSKKFENLHWNDTVRVNGYSFILNKVGDVAPLKNKLFLVRFNDPFNVARSYSARLNANWAQLGASVVNLEINGHVPQKEVVFLNKFIERYQLYDIEKKNKMATNAIKFLNSQLHLMRDSLNFLEDDVENFKHRNIITNMDSETGRLYAKLQGIEDQKFNYSLRENYYDYIIPLLNNEQLDGIFTPSSVGVNDNVVAGLISSLIEARSQINRYQGIEKKEENPLFREQMLRIRQIKADILKTIENSKATEAINHRFMDRQVAEIKRELARLPGTDREFINIKRDYGLKENLYVFLLQKRTEAGLSKASTTSDIVVVNPPLAGGPIFPKEDKNYIFALALGLILPLAGFALAEFLNDRIQSREDIEKLTHAPVIGGVGHNEVPDQLIVYKRPRSAMAESFRALRSNLSYFSAQKTNLVYLVTSSLPSEGKSFTTLNLASVFALAGKKTLIIGADLRRPKLYEELGLLNNVGLSQYLSGLATEEQIIQQSEVDGLYLIAGGPMPPNPSELLLRQGMDDLIRNMRAKFDYIIIDTPPLTLVADAFVLSKFADHSIFVVRQDFTPKGALRSLEEYYVSGKLSKISILFNDLRRSGFGYGYENYGYSGYGYYGYGYGKGKKTSGGYYED
jgi:capsular exopolysaccharide synthesis family protein